MTEVQQNCIVVAITLAKTERIKSIAKLRVRLRDHNFSDNDIEAAIQAWAAKVKGSKQ